MLLIRIPFHAVAVAMFGLLVLTPVTQAVVGGADISSLADIEKAGGIFRDSDGQSADEIKLLRDHGCQLFRVRLFVNPDPDFRKTDGATQNLDVVRTLGQRIKKAGGQFLLDIHYSDTWADPAHQVKPKAWQSLGGDALEKQVGDYTAAVIKDLQSSGAAPDMVQVGNEITSGILWPDARLSHGPKEKEPAQWQTFARLLSAGAKAVRASEIGGQKIKIVLHIHGGGREGLPQWFFKQFMANGGDKVDFDIIGLSFYPTWKDALGTLKQNMNELATTYGKDILLAEVGYPWAPVDQIEGRESMEWPMSPAGQADYLKATRQALAEVPGGHGLGFVWWYSDSINVPDKSMRIWRKGNEALFDHDGKPLPAMKLLSETR